MPRRPPRSPRFASLGNLFREARRASPQRQNNGACASDGAGLPWLSRKLRPEDCFRKPDGPAPSAEITGLPWLSASKIPPLCIARKLVSGSPSGEGGCRRSFGRRPENCFGKPDGPAPSAKITERTRATARVCHGCRGSFGRRPESCFEKPDGPAPSAEITERARATARVCHGCRRPRSSRFASLGNLFREARRANPQRQNDGSEREGGCRRSFGRRPELRPSPGKLFREARRASSQRQNYGSERERRAPSEAVAEASAVARKGFLGRPQRQNDGNELSGSPTGQTQAQTLRRFFASRKMARDAPGPGFCEP